MTKRLLTSAVLPALLAAMSGKVEAVDYHEFCKSLNETCNRLTLCEGDNPDTLDDELVANIYLLIATSDSALDKVEETHREESNTYNQFVGSLREAIQGLREQLSRFKREKTRGEEFERELDAITNEIETKERLIDDALKDRPGRLNAIVSHRGKITRGMRMLKQGFEAHKLLLALNSSRQERRSPYMEQDKHEDRARALARALAFQDGFILSMPNLETWLDYDDRAFALRQSERGLQIRPMIEVEEGDIQIGDALSYLAFDLNRTKVAELSQEPDFILLSRAANYEEFLFKWLTLYNGEVFFKVGRP